MQNILNRLKRDDGPNEGDALPKWATSALVAHQMGISPDPSVDEPTVGIQRPAWKPSPDSITQLTAVSSDDSSSGPPLKELNVRVDIDGSSEQSSVEQTEVDRIMSMLSMRADEMEEFYDVGERHRQKVESKLSGIQVTASNIETKQAQMRDEAKAHHARTDEKLVQLAEGQEKADENFVQLAEGQEKAGENLVQLAEGQEKLSEGQEKANEGIEQLVQGDERASLQRGQILEGQVKANVGIEHLVQGDERANVQRGQILESQDKVLEGQVKANVGIEQLVQGVNRILAIEEEKAAKAAELEAAREEKAASKKIIARARGWIGRDH